MSEDIDTWRGKKIESMSHEELVKALKTACRLYNKSLQDKMDAVRMFSDIAKARR